MDIEYLLSLRLGSHDLDLTGFSREHLRPFTRMDRPDSAAFVRIRAEEYPVEWSRRVNEEEFARARRILGVSHPSTLTTASCLAADLRASGEVGSARSLDEETLERRSQIFGDDHPVTLTSRHNLAVDLEMKGEIEGSCDLYRDGLARCRRILGDDAQLTISFASSLANNLRDLGDGAGAEEWVVFVQEQERRRYGFWWSTSD